MRLKCRNSPEKECEIVDVDVSATTVAFFGMTHPCPGISAVDQRCGCADSRKVTNFTLSKVCVAVAFVGAFSEY